jgi:hypothetical protein
MRDHNLLYVGVPKVATRSLLTALTSAPSASRRMRIMFESDVKSLLRRYPEAETYFKFTFVRNPWSRAASCYLDKIKNARPIRLARHLHNRYGLEAGMSFEAFAQWLNSEEGRDDVADRHWMSQHRVLALDQPGLIRYDFVGRLENLAADYKKLQDMTKLDLPPLTHKLKTQAPDGFRRHYNERSIEEIAKRYQRDIELFSYNFDDVSAREES